MDERVHVWSFFIIFHRIRDRLCSVLLRVLSLLLGYCLNKAESLIHIYCYCYETLPPSQFRFGELSLICFKSETCEDFFEHSEHLSIATPWQPAKTLTAENTSL